MREIQGKSILVWVSEGLSYRESTVFLFHKNLWTVGYLLFLVIYLNTISPYCLYFTFLVKTWLGGRSLPFFLLVKKRGCLKILYDLGPNLEKKICPFKTSSAPPAIYIMNVALCDVLSSRMKDFLVLLKSSKVSWPFAGGESYNLEILDHN